MLRKNSLLTPRGMVDVVLGLTFGDEGKGNVVTNILKLRKYYANARWQGGPNAGHTLVLENGKSITTHVIPSGAVVEGTILLMGNSMVIDPIKLKEEYLQLKQFGFDVKDRLFISENASLISPYHRLMDEAEEFIAKQKIGTTKSGIGPAYADRYARKFLRMGHIHNMEKLAELFAEANNRHQMILNGFIKAGMQVDLLEIGRELLKFTDACQWIKDNLTITTCFQEKVEQILSAGHNILGEGAQGVALDITNGDYPFVTASNTTAGGIFEGLSIGKNDFGLIYGVIKPYTTKVGGGDFPSIMLPEHEEAFQKEGNEVGATTGRKRICGNPDAVLWRRAITQHAGFGKIKLVFTKTDIFPKKFRGKFFPMITAYKYKDGTTTNNLRYPLSDVEGVETEMVECWYIPEGTTVYDKDIFINFYLFVNRIQNQLKDLLEHFEPFMMTTGPRTGQYVLYEG